MKEISTTKQTVESVTVFRRLEVTGTAAELDRRLNEVAAVKALRSQKAIFFLVIALVLIIVAATYTAQWSLPVKVTCVLGAALAFIRCLYWQLINIDKDRQRCAQEILTVIKRDLQETAPLTLNLGFLKVEDDLNKIKQGVTQAVYADQWFALRGKFVDGTKFAILVKEMAQVKLRKRKMKPKGFQLSLILVFAAKKYPGVSRFSSRASGSIQLPKGASVKSLRMTDDTFRLSVSLPPASLTSWTASKGRGQTLVADTIMMMLLSAYQVLNLASAINKKAN